MSLNFRWNSDIDWWALFARLCAITRPAHGMLHLFTPAERKLLDYQAFDGAVLGELAFTSAVAEDGNYVRPDTWASEARRRYRFLPELSWGNFLGEQFVEAFDRVELGRNTLQPASASSGALFKLTDHLSDVVDRPVEFEAMRSRARAALVAGTFRRIVLADCQPAVEQ